VNPVMAKRHAYGQMPFESILTKDDLGIKD